MAEDKRAIVTQKIAIGLLLLLFFSISLIALDYSIPLSLFLGLIGAGSGMFIVTWWYNEQPIATANTVSSPSGASRNRTRKRTNAPDVITAQRLRQDAEQERKKQQKQQQGAGKQRSIITAFFSRFR